MSCIIVPSRGSLSKEPSDLEEPVHYVEDWFRYERFDSAYMTLMEAGNRLSDNSMLEIGGINFWKPFVQEIHDPSGGNFKYLYPIATGVRDLLADGATDIVFVWPKKGDVTQLIRRLANEADSEIEIRIDPSCRNPIPREFKGEAQAEPTAYSIAVLKSFGVVLSLHLLLILGKLLPTSDMEGINLVSADKSHRELTDTILETESVVTSPLVPRLLGYIRGTSLDKLGEIIRRPLTTDEEEAFAEDIFRGSTLSLAPYVSLLHLLRSRQQVFNHLQDSLDGEFPHLPDACLEHSFEEAVLAPASLKYLVYTSLFDELSGISTLTSVSGGTDKKILLEMGRAFETETIDLNHSVLMNEPSEIRDDADTVVVKGIPDLQRLQETTTEKDLVLTGRPYNDKLFSRLDSTHSGDVPDLLRKSEMTVTIATEPIRDEHLQPVLQEVFRSEAADAVCLKLHPKESKETYRRLLSEIETDGLSYCVVYDEYALFDILCNTDVLVTISSNVGLEALLLGIPGLHVDVPPNIPLYYQEDNRFSQFVLDVDEVANSVDKFLLSGLDMETVKKIRELYLFDGKASDRLVQKVYTRFASESRR